MQPTWVTDKPFSIRQTQPGKLPTKGRAMIILLLNFAIYILLTAVLFVHRESTWMRLIPRRWHAHKNFYRPSKN